MDYIDLMCGEKYFAGSTFSGFEFEFYDVEDGPNGTTIRTPKALEGAVVTSQIRKGGLAGEVLYVLSTTDNSLEIENNILRIPERRFDDIGTLVGDLHLQLPNGVETKGVAPYCLESLNPITR